MDARREYVVFIHGIKHTFLLTPEYAERIGAELVEAVKPKQKARRVPRNKAVKAVEDK